MYIYRDIAREIQPFLRRKEVIAIVGPRQAGKTTFLQHLANNLNRTPKKMIYLTFEKIASLQLFENIEDFKELYQNQSLVLLDEFQYANDGGKKLKYLFDTTKTKYIISGSSSLDLKFQTGKYLVGRMLTFHLWPLTFQEFLHHKDPKLAQVLQRRVPSPFSFRPAQAFGQAIHTHLEQLFEEYLLFGGYPAAVIARTRSEKMKILESIIENYLLKDIRSLLQLSTERELTVLTRFAATQIGNLVNYQELSMHAELPYLVLKKHLHILQETFILKFIRPFVANKRTELTKNPKVYFIDSGFRNFLLNDFRPFYQREDVGALVENHVFVCLHRTADQLQPVQFWRTKNGAEVDFVIRRKNSIIPIEVKFSSKPTIGKSLHSFIEKYSPAQAIICTKGYSGQVIIKKTRVLFMPAYYW